MLRTQDLLLTLAAVCLLSAALDVKSRIIRASASQPSQLTRKSQAEIGQLMGKVMRSLDAGSSPAGSISRPTTKVSKQVQKEDQNHNSYRFYANETGGKPDESNGEQQQNAREVRVHFLRPPLSKQKQANQNSTTALLYMLNFTNSRRPEAGASSAEELGENEIELTGAAQQQQPPFTMLPPYNQQQPQQPMPFSLDNPNIRQILQNYQRNPQATAAQFQTNPHYQRLAQQALAAINQQGQQQQQQQPALPEVGQQKPPAPSNLQQGLANGGQQPFSPLQLLAGPFQAFLPGLAPALPSQQDQKAPPKEPNQPVPGLLNPFAPPPNQLSQQLQQQPPQMQQFQLPNLQTLYQQLPLYQALLAARQRQEALQAAQRMRQQQLPASRNNEQQRAKNQQPATQLQQPLLPFVFPQQPPQQPLWPSPLNNQQANQQPAGYLPAGPVLPAAPVGQQPNPVQFDDEAGQQPQQPTAAPQPSAPVEAPPEDQANSSGNGGGNQPSNNNDDDQQDNNNNNADQSGNNNDNNNEQPDNGQANEPAKPEEEDPDLKQFQNLANGGDAFTDLFPPGILSNNDISEIKKQQSDQAKKQEQEERQRQQQQQQQQQQPQDQPMNQYQNQPEQSGNGAEQDNNNNNNSENNDQPEEADNNEGNQEGGEGEGEEGGGGGGGSPQAEALTAKTNSIANSTIAATSGQRLSKSPGVEYN